MSLQKNWPRRKMHEFEDGQRKTTALNTGRGELRGRDKHEEQGYEK